MAPLGPPGDPAKRQARALAARASREEVPMPVSIHDLRAYKTRGERFVMLTAYDHPTAQILDEAGIPVRGHLGLTPQSVHLFGGYKVQGRSDEQAQRIRIWAKELEEAGAFALVLECVPSALAAEITAALSIPTIGIGAGPACDAQVLVVHDLVGLSGGQSPKFVKRYADVRTQIADAAKAFAAEVTSGTYPDDEHSYS